MPRFISYIVPIICTLALSAGTTACGDDSGGTDSGGTDSGGATDSATSDSSAADGAVGDGGGADSGAADTGADTSVGAGGCADGTLSCIEGLMCCSGVPYPAEGICQEMCMMRSDRHAKEQITPVDSEALLEQVVALPIAEWSYVDEEGVRHVGPMAQDFHASFGLGGDDRSIHPVDAAGVTLAALQALTRRVDGLQADNEALRAHNLRLAHRLELLEGFSNRIGPMD